MAGRDPGGGLREEMNDQRAASSKGPSFGLFLIGIGILALILARQISRPGLGDNRDPGPRAFPVALAAGLIAGGLIESARAGMKRFRTGRSQTENAATAEAAQAGENLVNALVLFAGLLLYLAAMPWCGFSVSTLLFSLGVMLRLGVRRALASVVSLSMIVAIHLLFVKLFKVQLPTGVLGLPW